MFSTGNEANEEKDDANKIAKIEMKNFNFIIISFIFTQKYKKILMKKIFMLIFIFICFKSFSQDNFDYLGVIKLSGNENAIITYRILFKLEKNVIKGYSITDLGGANETKNSISGNYNQSTKVLSFKENDILYTKSKFSEKSFCFVNFSGKLKLNDKNSKLTGDFKGMYKNNTNCIDGTLTLIGATKINKVLNRYKDKIQKSKKIDEKIKEKVNPVNILDSLKVNNLLKNQNLNVFINSETVVLEIWDPKSEDGDIVDLFVNDKLILKNYVILNQKKRISIKLDQPNNVFKINAINEGERLWNTAEIQIIDGERTFQLISYLKKGDNASITLIRKEN